MNINSMTKKEIMNVPKREWGSGDLLCSSLIIIPADVKTFDVLKYRFLKWLSGKTNVIREPEIYEIEGLHDSGFRIMNFVAIIDNEPFCKFMGSSDVLCMNGIGGLGKDWTKKPKAEYNKVDAAGWQIDCLRESGLMRIHCRGKILCGEMLSSFEIWYKKIE